MAIGFSSSTRSLWKRWPKSRSGDRFWCCFTPRGVITATYYHPSGHKWPNTSTTTTRTSMSVVSTALNTPLSPHTSPSEAFPPFCSSEETNALNSAARDPRMR
ncbi:unnamed protein product [Medioppia subpectinata]|uniref:Uncharacterized protein n=1 Tax=Medioppia subpectinata TaxID=1979941 RepID=A0A7R9LXY7_9ACAR|nr:unnamed protein product [Medioppia subpectinata]CAG2122684.1 unnamed protein product [Medioppia subpectinata]